MVFVFLTDLERLWCDGSSFSTRLVLVLSLRKILEGKMSKNQLICVRKHEVGHSLNFGMDELTGV